MPSNYQVRAAVPSDVDPVLAFWREHAEGTDRHDDAAAVQRLLEHDGAALLLAVDETEIVGTVIAGWDGWRCHLYRIAVHQDRRQQGIARVLIAQAEERFRTLGAGRVDAMVLQDNHLAHAAWDALGYRPQEQWRRWVKVLPPPKGTVGS